MGICESSSCWDFLMPSPASMSKTAGNQDVHLQPAPANSFLLLGHVALEVSRETPARLFYGKGFGLTVDSQEAGSRELRFNAGPSQLRVTYKEDEDELKESAETHGNAGFDKNLGRIELLENLKRCDPFFYEGKDADLLEARLGNYANVTVWPGEIRLWCQDCRVPYDTFNTLKCEFPRTAVKDYYPPISGEFGVVVKDPWEKNTFLVEDCPPSLVPQWQALCPSGGDGQQSNTLGLLQVTYRVRAKSSLAAVAGFYTKCLGAAADLEEEACVVHFSPREGVHQTLKFVVDDTSSGQSGTICIYARSAEQFKRAFEACGPFAAPKSWDVVARTGEFKVEGCHDPQTQAQVLPLRQLIRSPTHRDCPIQQAGQ